MSANVRRVSLSSALSPPLSPPLSLPLSLRFPRRTVVEAAADGGLPRRAVRELLPLHRVLVWRCRLWTERRRTVSRATHTHTHIHTHTQSRGCCGAKEEGQRAEGEGEESRDVSIVSALWLCQPRSHSPPLPPPSLSFLHRPIRPERHCVCTAVVQPAVQSCFARGE